MNNEDVSYFTNPVTCVVVEAHVPAAPARWASCRVARVWVLLLF